MSKTKKIVIAAVSVVIAAVVVFLAIFPTIRMNEYEKISAEDPPAKVVDFAKKPDGVIRVMSFNIRYGKLGIIARSDRNEVVVETIKKGMPDSFGVQEATPAWMRYLKRELKDLYDYVGVGRANGKGLGEYSAIFYLKDKYDVYDSDTFWLSETPEKPSKGWDASVNRICTWAILENKETGEQYLHINSHFDHIGSEAQKNSVDMILEKVKEYNFMPVVFTADMNIEEGSDLYNTMAKSEILWDTKYIAKDTMDFLTFHNMKPSENEGRVIDFVMINQWCGVVSYKVVTAGIDGKFVSDHYPVYADIVLRK